MTTFPLPLVGEVVIGSGEGADIRLAEQTVAERHALLTLGARMELRDLGSGLPTVVGSRRLTPDESTPVAPGVVLLLGSVTVVVQASGASTRLRHVRSHDYFEGRLEDECARAEGTGSPFAVMRLRFGRGQGQAVEEAFTRLLRPVDLVAMYSADEYELLLLDVDATKAAATAHKLG